MLITGEEQEYLLSKLESNALDEADVDLVLTFLRQESKCILGVIEKLLKYFPHHAKSLYYCIKNSVNIDEAQLQIEDFIRSEPNIPEFQLFWLLEP